MKVEETETSEPQWTRHVSEERSVDQVINIIYIVRISIICWFRSICVCFYQFKWKIIEFVLYYRHICLNLASLSFHAGLWFLLQLFTDCYIYWLRLWFVTCAQIFVPLLLLQSSHKAAQTAALDSFTAQLLHTKFKNHHLFITIISFCSLYIHWKLYYFLAAVTE